MPQTQGRTSTQGQESKAGRLDLLAMDMADHFAAKMSGNPVVAAVYPTYRPLLDAVVSQFLSPEVLTGTVKRKKRRTTKRGRA